MRETDREDKHAGYSWPITLRQLGNPKKSERDGWYRGDQPDFILQEGQKDTKVGINPPVRGGLQRKEGKNRTGGTNRGWEKRQGNSWVARITTSSI